MKNKLLFSNLILGSVIPVVSLGTIYPTKNALLIQSYSNSIPLISQPKSLEELKKLDPTDIAKLSKYDSSECEIVTPAEQQPDSTCWAFALASNLETSILKNELYPQYNKNNLNIDEANIDYLTNIRSQAADKLGFTLYETFSYPLHKGQDRYLAAQMLMKNEGPALEGDSGSNAQFNKKPIAFVKDIINIGSASIDELKLAISTYGSISAGYFCSGQTWKSVYWNSDGIWSGPHAITIIGWDDSIPKESFTRKHASVDGAWIVKNSWGSDSGRGDGCFYLSYDSYIKDILALNCGKAKDYENVYFWNGSRSVYSDFRQKKAAAVFPSKKATSNTKEMIKAVSFGLSGGKNIDVKVSVYKNLKINGENPLDESNNPTNGEPVSTTTKSFKNSGFYTVDLETPVEIKNGEYFSAVVEITNSADSFLYFSKEPTSYNDMTFYEENGIWKNSNNNDTDYVAEIKLLTTTETIGTTESNDLRYADLSLDASQYINDTIYRYNDLEKPKIVVKYKDKSLVEDTDYTVSYTGENFLKSFVNNNNDLVIGYGEITVQGIGNYSGKQIISYPIKIGLSPNLKDVFQVEEISGGNPKVIMTVGSNCNKYKDIPLPSNWQWAFPDQEVLSGVNDKNYVKYIGDDVKFYRNDMFSVVLTKTSSVIENPKDIKEAKVNVDLSNEFIFDGKPKTPKVTVTDAQTELKLNVDYKIEYKNNINSGNAEIVITGIGNYTNQQVIEFKIKKANNSIKIQFDQTANKYIVNTNDGNVYYKYFSDEQCTKLLDAKPKVEGTYWVKAYVDETTNYLASESKPFKYVISSSGAPSLPNVDASNPTSPNSPSEVIKQNKDQNISIILAIVIIGALIIACLGLGFYFKKKRKNKTNK